VAMVGAGLYSRGSCRRGRRRSVPAGASRTCPLASDCGRGGTLRMSPDALARAAADAVDEPALVDLLARLVRIRSYSAGGEEGRIAGFVAEQLRALGLEVTLQEVQPGRFNCVGRWHGAGGGTSLMLNGHLDTNPAGEGWTRDPLGGEVDDRFVYGIGVSNMKAA